MTTLTVEVHGDGMKRFANLAAALGEGEVRTIAARALKHTGGKARTQVKRALAKQTGLPQKVIQRALKVKAPTVGNPKYGGFDARLSYVITSHGGDIALKYFNPKEFRAGVKASPFGHRELFPGTFMMGGRFPDRVPLGLGGHVFKRAGEGRNPIEKQTSGVIIPDEMVKGASARAFEDAAQDLDERLSHEMARSRKLRDLTGGSVF